MGQSPARIVTARAERRAMIALVAVFALLVQALIPAMAMAGPLGAGPGMIVCAPVGPHDGSAGDAAPKQGAPTGTCDHCICATPAVPTPPSAAAPIPVRYVAQAERLARPDDAPTPGRGLAAPPPPSRGPPSLLT